MGAIVEQSVESLPEKLATLDGDTEEAKARRRAFDSLLQVGSRMNYLAMAGAHPDKIAAELGGMSAWVAAFACQLVGVPLGAGAIPTGEVVLASLETEEHTPCLFTVRAALPTEGLQGVYPDAASRPAALALGLVSLARALIDRDRLALPKESPADVRHRQAETDLGLRLGHALVSYEASLDASTAPEPSFHGSGSVD